LVNTRVNSAPHQYNMPPTHARLIHHRVGGWLPKDQRVLERWLAKKIAKVDSPERRAKAFHPVIQEFQTLIETDAEIWMGFHQMFEQVPTKPPYDNDPTGQPQVRDARLNYGI